MQEETIVACWKRHQVTSLRNEKVLSDALREMTPFRSSKMSPPSLLPEGEVSFAFSSIGHLRLNYRNLSNRKGFGNSEFLLKDI